MYNTEKVSDKFAERLAYIMWSYSELWKEVYVYLVNVLKQAICT